MLTKTIGALLATLVVVLISNFADVSTTDVAAGLALFLSFYAGIEIVLLKVYSMGIMKLLLQLHGAEVIREKLKEVTGE